MFTLRLKHRNTVELTGKARARFAMTCQAIRGHGSPSRRISRGFRHPSQSLQNFVPIGSAA
jgi:hypothetical protein